MPSMFKAKSSHKKLKRQLLIVMLIIFGWSVAIGFILGLATSTQAANPPEIGTVDVVRAQYKLGKELYIENCSTCHLALPPEVFPTQTWKNILEDSQHYGATITPLIGIQRNLVWKYVSTFSRVQLQDEETPYRLNRSRYFKALHPGVELPNPVTMGSCVSCHSGANEYNFRQLTAEWEK
ncbi:cytochrome C [Anabaena aphanizomenioides LEGE 00250]|uniref:Cytochrome C n=1 Tax=Sphaerospermopsis aphanizomenoides LEGE 00250 TaxID=2777972 RepID=A0ABR9V7R7_9CYAN|nr:cytochrome C [Sphaerospermopsis aphanizomenoides]MBE9234532.1 cytochrome C [Sphaerospermopsis aphanizomenoides LEGE 00250]